MKNTKSGKKCRPARAEGAAAAFRPTLASLSRLINQKTIVDFVQTVEDTKGFVPNPDKVFRHLASELGELDAAMYEVDKISPQKITKTLDKEMIQTKDLRNFFCGKVGNELLDIIFLACYMADIYGVNLNKIAKKRAQDIMREYSVTWPKRKR